MDSDGTTHHEDAATEADWESFAADGRGEEPQGRVEATVVIAAVVALLVLAGIVLLRPTGETRERATRQLDALGVPSDLYDATIEDLLTGPCDFDPTLSCTQVTFRIEQGPDAGARYVQLFTGDDIIPDFSVGQQTVLSYLEPDGLLAAVEYAGCSFDPQQECARLGVVLEDGSAVEHEMLAAVAPPFAVGDRVLVTSIPTATEPEVVAVTPLDIATQYQYADRQRRPVLLWAAIAFAAAVVLLGRWRGLAALGGLGLSVAVLLMFVLPAIVDGRNPLLVAIVGSSAVAYVALYLAHGFTRMTTIALLGTLIALALTSLLSAGAVAVAGLTGLASEESTLLTLFEGIDIRGLVLAGMVLGAAGAIDDVTVTQASAVWELRAANPELSPADLVRSGLRIGRDHIASTVNTLLLAYAGAALPLLVLFVLTEQSLGAIANSEIVAVEIIRTFVGSIGLVSAVPVTTWLAAAAVTRTPATPAAHG